LSSAAASPPLDASDIPESRRTLITISLMLASIMQSLDNTIANVALPHIQGSVSATQDQISWVLTSYIIAAAIMTPLSGWLAGRFGRKRIFLYSIVGFTVTSMLCGLAQTLPEIVVARALQGLCGAALVPMSQAVLLDIYPPERHSRAMSIWIMGVVLGPVIGPALGGWLTENYNWRWVFFINLPFGILSFLGILSTMQETPGRESRFDFFGFSTLSLGIAALQMTLDRGQLKDWFSSPEIWVEATLAGIGFYLFIVHMLTTKQHPFVSPALFRDRNYLTGNVFVFVMGLILFATLALLPPLLQELLNYPVVTTGLVTAPRGIGTFLSMLFVGRLMKQLDMRVVIGIGFVLTALSLWQMTSFNMQMNSATVIWSGVIQGVGMGFVYVPLAAATFATLSPALRNEGTALFSLLRNLGSSIGISIVEALLTRNTQTVHASLGEHITALNPAVQALMPNGIPDAHVLAQLNNTLTRQALMIAYNDDFQLMMILSLAALPLLLLLRKGGAAAKSEPIAIE
jgi:DHA2 family multidrug resistance protein